MGEKKLILLIVVVGILASVALLGTNARKWHFKGVVTNVKYDQKGFPTVRVNNKKYYLSRVTWDYTVKIHKGDTLIKEKGDLRVKLIRPNTHDTIYFDENDRNPEKWRFKGKIENVLGADEKKYVYVMVNGREYDLDGSIWKIDFVLQRGDYIVKNKGEEKIQVIKPDRKDTLIIPMFWSKYLDR